MACTASRTPGSRSSAPSSVDGEPVHLPADPGLQRDQGAAQRRVGAGGHPELEGGDEERAGEDGGEHVDHPVRAGRGPAGRAVAASAASSAAAALGRGARRRPAPGRSWSGSGAAGRRGRRRPGRDQRSWWCRPSRARPGTRRWRPAAAAWVARLRSCCGTRVGAGGHADSVLRPQTNSQDCLFWRIRQSGLAGRRRALARWPTANASTRFPAGDECARPIIWRGVRINEAAQFEAMLRSDRSRDRDRALRISMSPAAWQRVIVERPALRRWLPFHRSVPLDVLQQLARDPDVEVRWAVAYSPRASSAMLRTLGQDVDWRVRTGVAGNRRAPRRIARALLADPVAQVAQTARWGMRMDGVTGADSPRTSRFDMTRWAAARCYRFWWFLGACLLVAVGALTLRTVLPDMAGIGIASAAAVVAMIVVTLRLRVLSFRRWPRHADVPETMSYIVSEF